jgi:hypothetical protein
MVSNQRLRHIHCVYVVIFLRTFEISLKIPFEILLFLDCGPSFPPTPPLNRYEFLNKQLLVCDYVHSSHSLFWNIGAFLGKVGILVFACNIRKDEVGWNWSSFKATKVRMVCRYAVQPHVQLPGLYGSYNGLADLAVRLIFHSSQLRYFKQTTKIDSLAFWRKSVKVNLLHLKIGVT